MKKLTLRTKKYLALLVALTFALTLIPALPAAATNVSEDITSDITWTLANSPYIMTGSVFVRNGATLTIEPGVTVKFDKGEDGAVFALCIGLALAPATPEGYVPEEGTLIANGTVANPITFTSNQASPAPGDWDSIYFSDLSDDTNCIVDNCVIKYALWGIMCESASPTISNNMIANMGGAIEYDGVGIFCLSSSSPNITNNIITDNSNYGIFCISHSSPLITGNTITYSGRGICCYESSSPTINGNTIANNENGVTCSSSSSTITNNIIYSNNENGIFCDSSNLTIVNNTIVKNEGNGIDCGASSNSTVINNIVTLSGNYGVSFDDSSTYTMDYNDIWMNSGDNYSGCEAGENDISVIPSFTDVVNDDYHLQAGSLCIDAGTNEGAPGTDFEGNPRPCDGDEDGVAVVDMGADEYVTSTTASFVIGQSSYTLNGVATTMDAASYIKNSRTYVPVRYLAYSLGITDSGIGWDSEAQTVTLTKGGTTVILVIGSKIRKINGTSSTMDVPPEISNGRTMLPARWVAEAFGATVDWNGATQTVLITYL